MNVVSVLMMTLPVAQAASQPSSAPAVQPQVAQIQTVVVESAVENANESANEAIDSPPAAIPLQVVRPSDVPATDAEVLTLGWQRLKSGDFRGAIELFNDVLEKDVKNAEARKGKARALVSLGDYYGKAGNGQAQARSYRDALEVDPSLADDASFIDRYQNRVRVPASRSAFIRPPAKRPAPPRPNREGHWLGMQLHVGPEALGGLGVSLLLFQHLQITGTVDFVFPAVDAEAKLLLLKSAWSPFLSAGFHFRVGGFKPVKGFELFQSNFLHVAIGAQYFHESGFFLNLGLSWLPPISTRQSANPPPWSMLWPQASIGWIFGGAEKEARHASPKTAAREL